MDILRNIGYRKRTIYRYDTNTIIFPLVFYSYYLLIIIKLNIKNVEETIFYLIIIINYSN